MANAAGCDSIVTTNLTITPVNNTVIDLSPLLVAQSTTGTFQWVDCDNGNAIIPGETGQSFTPTATGNYAVQVTENGCTLQSACYTIISTAGQSEMNLENIVVYPNPTKGWFTLESNQIGSDFLLTTIDGKIIMKGAIENKNQKIDLSEEVDGVYMLQVLGESGTSIIKVVKK
ncbi:MAG: T9SS type A sorting domain-containing protein [Crocinitomicaceae bacterium]|nr:T9SS type A sorting domain-containing protein [Crocinitomicaceae bacterium]MDG1657074.1 T9SS type A sorting domain-containing protein [Crocinitomicaceae bacterium]MDG2441125.1 T9SS type A sorting domain-containing protein [Crocinitomicaceae bacterium]